MIINYDQHLFQTKEVIKKTSNLTDNKNLCFFFLFTAVVCPKPIPAFQSGTVQGTFVWDLKNGYNASINLTCPEGLANIVFLYFCICFKKLSILLD
jgi:hypothetical protein